MKCRMVYIMIVLTLATGMLGTLTASASSNYDARLQALSDANRNAEVIALAKVGAAAGDRDAEYWLGTYYDSGTAVKVDKGKAFFWLHKASLQGQVQAQDELASLYSHGEGVAESEAQAFYWYNQAAQQGDNTGLYNAALFYETGTAFLAKDFPRAVAMMRQAARQGDESARSYLVVNMKVSDESPAPPRATVVSCKTHCVNAACSRYYPDGRHVEFQARQKFNPLTNTFEWDPGTC